MRSTRPSKRVRKGFWNKRGDHCTASGFVVYAPYDQAFLPDQDYPDESQGFLNADGHRVNPNQPREPPDSFPRHGQPPLRGIKEKMSGLERRARGANQLKKKE